ncbi:hypothetical protein [Desulfoluna butyratoxydans]|uniref:Uncharacterized protein n=1 Tax=Desulfoluna butyratoxydans TaxID=231438 RepID=A0A4U8YUW9_9BACT|nr:hypothetical protein [Desulfoluna butyratoxydans]VFQ47377.1 hypothetical protein MSL71_50770 [Desulfoluna butyratoxydans]
MCKQITFTEGTVEDIRGTLERGAHVISYLMGVLDRGETLRPEDMDWLRQKWEADIAEGINRLETEGRYV